MRKFRNRPYNLLLLAAAFLFVSGLFGFNYPVDIHLHDTYVILPIAFLIWLPVIALIFVWLVYLFTKHLLFSNILTWIHVGLTIICSLFICPLAFFSTHDGMAGMPRRYYDFSTFSGHSGDITGLIAVALIAFFVGQLVYLINLFAGLFRKLISKQYNR